MTSRPLVLRTRTVSADGGDQLETVVRPEWDPARAAVVVCDMWDTHSCLSAARRADELAPQMNSVIRGLRDQGALVIHAPADCVDFYRDTPARLRALNSPHAESHVPMGWNFWEPDERAALPASLVELGPCSCEPAARCCRRESPRPRGHNWGTEQIVAHIERRWCPTVTSDQLIGGMPFRFHHPR